MTDRELMQQALNVLKIFVDGGNSAWARKIIEIKEALRDRLAQPDEPDWSAAGFSKPPKQQDRQCPSCGGFCKKSGCERENVQPEQRSEQWWKHEVSNAWAEGYEKGRLQREWQGLTDEDREAIALLVEKMGMEGYGTLAIAAAIRKGEM